MCIRLGPLRPHQVPGEAKRPRRRGRRREGLSHPRGRGHTPRPAPAPSTRPGLREPSPRSTSPFRGRRRARASHLDRGQGPGGCARGGAGVGGAGCRHFRSSPSRLSTCCCEGPAGTGRVSRRRARAVTARTLPPALPAPRPAPSAPVRRCATSLLGPLVMVYMVRRARPPARSPGRTPCPTLRPGSHSAGAQGAAPLTGSRAQRGGGGPLHAPGP